MATLAVGTCQRGYDSNKEALNMNLDTQMYNDTFNWVSHRCLHVHEVTYIPRAGVKGFIVLKSYAPLN